MKMLVNTKALKKVAFAQSKEEVRYYLNGVYFDFESNKSKIRYVATDGYRLAMIEIDKPKNINSDCFIVHRNSIDAILKAGDGDLNLKDERDFIFKSNIAEFEHRLLEGTYPDYNRVIPDNKGFQISFNRKLMLKAIEEIITKAKYYNIGKDKWNCLETNRAPLTFDFLNAKIKYNQLEVDCPIIGKHDVILGINAKYIKESLKALSGDIVTICLNEKSPTSSPIVINEDNITHVLMPLRF